LAGVGILGITQVGIGDGALVGAILITDMAIIHIIGILIIGVEVTILVITVGEVIQDIGEDLLI
jgi:hypothetical protein